ncbi:WEB family protein At5g55860-like [Chenopodium quinoa]|uniref:WEB family protein n=1 Tax=Chenopodium quinoa TaxID=63459 RepID=A0A803M1H8_CHEQI|nr:WEB family protein At5g55860-like [Chenopodium quinoa]
MMNIARTRQNSIGSSPKAVEVGEIDTKAPFQSVKDAVSLFVEASSSLSPKAKPLVTKNSFKPQAQVVLDKEAQLHIALNELNRLKEQLRGAESKKIKTIPELDKARRTFDELNQKLKSINESKKSVLENSEALNVRARELEEAISSSVNAQDMVDSVQQDLDATREEYNVTILELDASKQLLNSVRREYDTILEAKAAALRDKQKANAAAEAHQHRVSDLTKQISSMQEAIAKIKFSSKDTEEEHQKLSTNKREDLCSDKLSKEELEHKLLTLKNEHQSLLSDENLQLKLVETKAEILYIEEKLSKARAAYLESHKGTTFELENAKKSLEKIAEEKSSVQHSVESLEQELEHIGKELAEQKHKQKEIDALVNKLQAEVDDNKNVLEAGVVNKTSAADVSDDTAILIEQLTLETERARQGTQEMKKEIEERKQESKTFTESIAEMENKLASLSKEVEEAKAAERAAQDEIKDLSEKAEAAEESSSESSGKIKLSNEDYNSLMEKADESEKLADIKVTANMALVEDLVASQKEAAKKYEAVSKEIEELKMKEEEALKTAEMAEAAKSALEVELHRRHQPEQINQTTEAELALQSDTEEPNSENCL